jgi:CPA1 family monovalent cation:H+ antiporter
MGILEISAVLLTLAALFSYINFRFLKFPATIGMMIFSLGMALLLLGLDVIFPGVAAPAERLVESIDFNKTLMHGMLAFLLFAGALHVDINDLGKRKVEVIVLSTVGILISTFIIAGLTYLLAGVLELQLEFIHCLLFGALISPTDPIAVMGIFKSLGASPSLEIKMKGESLFNDGVGVVVFLVIVSIAYPSDGHGEPSIMEALKLFTVEAIGGIIFGLIIGYVAFLLLKSIEDYSVEIMITLALVMGGFTLANSLHTSGPLAIVVAGLLIGNHGRKWAMGVEVRRHLDTFYILIDEILNALLFLLIGFEVLVLSLEGSYLIAGLIAIPIALFGRFIAVGVPISLMRLNRAFSPKVIRILTWGGLRGGISVALALSLPEGVPRQTILTMTYIVVTFSIVVQGLTLKYLLNDSAE